MMQADEMVSAVRAALERHSEVNPHEGRITLAVHDGVLVMGGEVPDIIARRAAHLAAVETLGVERVLDELRVTPAERRSDGQIAEFLERLLMQESAFRDYARQVAVAETPPAGGTAPPGAAITATVHDGVVTLAGTVGSLTHRRLADVLAWWTPGTYGVRNFLHVVPDEQDNDGELTDALRMVLDKDPWLDTAAITVHVTERKVTLEGVVASPEQRRMAERDAWYILGVHGVDNRLRVE
jgi:osmotically-inducible protein OsmY